MHKTVLPGPAGKPMEKVYKSQFLYLMFQVIYTLSNKSYSINSDHLPLQVRVGRYGAYASAYTRTILSLPGPAELPK